MSHSPSTSSSSICTPHTIICTHHYMHMVLILHHMHTPHGPHPLPYARTTKWSSPSTICTPHGPHPPHTTTWSSSFNIYTYHMVLTLHHMHTPHVPHPPPYAHTTWSSPSSIHTPHGLHPPPYTHHMVLTSSIVAI